MKRILHIPARSVEAEAVCHTIVACLATIPDIEQRVFRSTRSRYPVRLRGEIRRFRPGFVHFHTSDPAAAAGLLAALPANTKLIVHWHPGITPRRSLHRLMKPVETALLRRADVIVGTSPRYVDASKPLESFRAKCVVIPSAIDPGRLKTHPARLAQIRWRYGDKPLLFFSGQRIPSESLEHLMSAVPLLKHDCRVVVGGEVDNGKPAAQNTGPTESEMVYEKIHFTGRIPPGDLAAWYTAADIFLLPSTTRDEAFGSGLAEAMWCGTPAVTFTVPGSDVNWVNLNGVTGIEVDNGNISQLAAAIDHLLTHDDMRREYGAAARRRVEEHMTLERVAPALEALHA